MAQSNTRISNIKPKIVGLYGVSGSGKTHLLNSLRSSFDNDRFSFFEGSEEIANVVPGGLALFIGMSEEMKERWREAAIENVSRKCARDGKVAIITGHLMFWSEHAATGGQLVWTQKDSNTYTHILYLNVSAEKVSSQRERDTRNRSPVSLDHIRAWQETEKAELQNLCRSNGILFALLSPRPTVLHRATEFLDNFADHTQDYNLHMAETKLDSALAIDCGLLKTVLALDADRTLAADDTGKLFWSAFFSNRGKGGQVCPLDTIFQSPLDFSYNAFRQVCLLYDYETDEEEFEVLCQKVASTVTIYEDFRRLLRYASEAEHVGVIVITCGLRRIWEIVLERADLSQKVKVIGGGRVGDSLVVDAEVKGALVDRLHNTYNVYVWAFSDSRLDIPMMRKADRAIVVVGKEHARSRTMDGALIEAMRGESFRPCQVRFPSYTTPRLELEQIPEIRITDDTFIEDISSKTELQITHATDSPASRLLSTPLRNAVLRDPPLRMALQRIGGYLAVQYLSDIVGLEEYSINHVQGSQIHGRRLQHEETTLIVALMRSGEPLALGISDVFPLAMFLHAKDTPDIGIQHLQNHQTVILVDAVVNTGKTIMQFVQHIRSLRNAIRIIVVTYVAQAQTISGGRLAKAIGPDVTFIALRTSENKYTGTGTIDTGNRLFNTTHLP
ncbi:MAG: hypothetical protein Q9160_007475 [Pyrenula sp. 1 TL-2023]